MQFAIYIEDTLSQDGKPPYIGDEVPSLKVNGEPVIELTAGSIKSMPAEDVTKFYAHLAQIPFEMATSPYFWGALTLSLMKDRLIQPLWLAHHDESSTGNSVIDKFKKAEGTDDASKAAADSLMRRVIRSLFSPGLFRGAPEMYSDCSLASAWWCGYLAAESARELNDVDKAEATRAMAAMWSTVAIYLSGRLTVLRELNNIAALVKWYLDTKSDLSGDTIKSAVRSLGELSSCHLTHFYDPKFIAEQLPVVTK